MAHRGGVAMPWKETSPMRDGVSRLGPVKTSRIPHLPKIENHSHDARDKDQSEHRSKYWIKPGWLKEYVRRGENDCGDATAEADSCAQSGAPPSACDVFFRWARHSHGLTV